MAQGAVAARRPTVVRRTIAAALVTLVTLTGALAGCGKPAPGPTPTSASSAPSPTATETSPTPTPSPSPTPPAKPAAWTTNDDTGALAAAQYFMDLYNYVIATGDLTEWQALASPDCTFCTNVAKALADVAARGNSYQGGEITTSGGKVAGTAPSIGGYGVQLEYTTAERHELGPSGTLVRSIPAEHQWVILDLMRDGDGWLLLEADSRPEPAS